MRADWLVVGDGVEQVGDFVHEGVLPTDDVTLRPPVLPPGVVGLGNKYLVPTFGFFDIFAHPEHFQLVHAFQIEANTALLAIDLEVIGVFAPGGETAGSPACR